MTIADAGPKPADTADIASVSGDAVAPPVVAAPPQGGAPPADELAPPGTLRSVVIGSVVGVVGGFVFVAGGMAVSGFTGTEALAVGGMGALWGGLGFGSMFGGVMHLTKLEALEGH
jgi:hypothetical protein